MHRKGRRGSDDRQLSATAARLVLYFVSHGIPMNVLPTPEQILSSPDVSDWLKQALRGSLTRDPVDVANEAELLAQVLSSRAKLILEEALTRLT